MAKDLFISRIVLQNDQMGEVSQPRRETNAKMVLFSFWHWAEGSLLALLSPPICSGFVCGLPVDRILTHIRDSLSWSYFYPRPLPFFSPSHFLQSLRSQKKFNVIFHIILKFFRYNTYQYFKISSSSQCFLNLAVRIFFQISHLNSFQYNKIHCVLLYS